VVANVQWGKEGATQNISKLGYLSSKPLREMSCVIDLALVYEKPAPELTRTGSKLVAKFQKG
jgi:hypothetical protein